ncbi:MAG: zinc ABC transporter substrate-binding protein [Candidatus Komeilibacteria bacterium]|nr:zinc ABC transporter substrate-binding protein [Candidatus Komeilibacteria bacterium]
MIMKFSKQSYIFFVLIGTAVVGAVLFVNVIQRNSPSQSVAGIRVAATIFPLYDIVRSIGGDTVDVTLLLPEGQPAEDMAARYAKTDFEQFKTVFAVGHGFDADGIPAAMTDRLTVVDTDVELILEQGSTANPFYWLSPKEAMHITDSVAAKLSQLDPQHAAAYEKRRVQFQAALAALDTNIRDLMGQLQVRTMAVYGYDWSYFARDYGLSIVWYAPTGGISDTDQQELGNLISKFGIRTIFSDVTIDPSPILPVVVSKRIAMESLDAFGGIEDHNGYVTTMAANARTIFDTLNTPSIP